MLWRDHHFLKPHEPTSAGFTLFFCSFLTSLSLHRRELGLWLGLGFGLRQGFPGGSDGKEPDCNARDSGSILGWEDPLQYSCLENSMRQRGLAGHSPWGRKVYNWETFTLGLKGMLWLIWSSLQTTETFSMSAARLLHFLIIHMSVSRTFNFFQKLFFCIHNLVNRSVPEAYFSACLSSPHAFLTKLNHF